MAVIPQGLQAPGLHLRDETSDKSVSVDEIRDAVDLVGGFESEIDQNTTDIAYNNDLLKKTINNSLVSVYPNLTGEYASVGGANDTIPSGTTHLVINDGTSSFLVELDTAETGVISALDTTALTATVGGSDVKLWRVKAKAHKKYLIVASDYTLQGDEGDAEVLYSLASSYSAGGVNIPLANPFGATKVRCKTECFIPYDSVSQFLANEYIGWFTGSATQSVGVSTFQRQDDLSSLVIKFGNSNIAYTNRGQSICDTVVASSPVRIWVEEDFN